MVRDDNAQYISLMQAPVHPDDLTVHCDAVRSFILGSCDIVGDKFPFVQNDVSHRSAFIFGTGCVREDPSGLRSIVCVVNNMTHI